MGWLARWRNRHPRRILHLRDVTVGIVQVSGLAEATDVLVDPTTGQPVLAIDYRAWPPSTTVGMDGATAHGSRAFQINVHQAVDFTLTDGREQVLVRVPRGNDVAATHQSLLQRFGVGLRTEVHVVPDAIEVVVIGRAELRKSGRSPHRNDPHLAVIQAARFWPLHDEEA